MKSKQYICKQSLKEIEAWCKAEKIPLFSARQIYEWLWKKSVRSFDLMTNLSVPLRRRLEEEFIFSELKEKEVQKSSDETIKYTFLLYDDKVIESVLIPAENRTTACVSTQAGCALACSFCATGKMGFYRNLDASEIFDQVVKLNSASLEIYGHALNNIVYMGMGEPLLNYEQTITSIAHLTDKKFGLDISPQRITVSTAGLVKEIRRLGNDKVDFQLAISLHTANQKKRIEIIPLAKKHTIEQLSAAIKYFHEKTESRIVIEYLLLDGFNDDIKDARELAAFCLDFPVKINIIEYNAVEGIPFKKSSVEKTDAFKKFLKSRNLVVNIRKSRGEDIAAACGQLAKNK